MKQQSLGDKSSRQLFWTQGRRVPFHDKLVHDGRKTLRMRLAVVLERRLSKRRWKSNKRMIRIVMIANMMNTWMGMMRTSRTRSFKQARRLEASTLSSAGRLIVSDMTESWMLLG
jgi:hypothetical protein